MWCSLLHHVQINFILRGLLYFLLPCAADCSCVRQTSWFVLPTVCSARFDWPASHTAAHCAVWLCSGASVWRGIPPPQSGWHTEITKTPRSAKMWREIFRWVLEFLDKIRTFTTGSLPFSRSNSSCSSLTLSSRFLSSSPLLHSLCSVCLSRCDSCSERCCKESSSCCILLRRLSFSCADKNHKCWCQSVRGDPPHLSRASHLHEHGAGLWGDGGQLLQEALGDAQVLFQALVLCWQTQNSLLRVCRPLSDQNTTFNLMMGDKMWNTGCWVWFLQPKCFKHRCFKQFLALAHFNTCRGCSQSWELFLALLYTTLQLVNLSKTTYT